MKKEYSVAIVGATGAVGAEFFRVLERRNFPVASMRALASGNAISLEVADSEKFLANIAYTCQHLYPKPKLVVLNYPHNPSTVTVDPYTVQ